MYNEFDFIAILKYKLSMKEEDQLLLNQDIDLNFVLILRKIQHREDKFSLTKNGFAQVKVLKPKLQCFLLNFLKINNMKVWNSNFVKVEQLLAMEQF